MSDKYVLNNAQLLDVERGEILHNRSILIENGRISNIDEGSLQSAEATVIDLHGKVVMPGLIDAHTHATITTMNLNSIHSKPDSLIYLEAAPILEGMLMRGFTTVRDTGGGEAGLRDAIEKGIIEGPRMFYSGRMLSQTGGHGDHTPNHEGPSLCSCAINSNFFAHVADGVGAVRRATREELKRGASQIKFCASGGIASSKDPLWSIQYSEEEMRAIVEEAENWGAYAICHAHTPAAISRAAKAGVRSIEHGSIMDDKTIEVLVECGTYVVPTLIILQVFDELGPTLGLPPEMQAKVQEVLESSVTSLQKAHQAGIKIGFGTDLLGETHPQQGREFDLRRQVMSELEIIRSATLVNAEIMKKSGEIGILKPDAWADLIVVDGNPLEDISVLSAPEGRHIDLIMKGGRIYKNTFVSV